MSNVLEGGRGVKSFRGWEGGEVCLRLKKDRPIGVSFGSLCQKF